MEETQKYTNRAQRRQKIKESYKNKPENDLIYIPAKKQLPPSENAPKKRTAAYCRVSTDDPAQTTSYELQKEHYEEEINKNPDWIFAGISFCGRCQICGELPAGSWKAEKPGGIEALPAAKRHIARDHPGAAGRDRT